MRKPKIGGTTVFERVQRNAYLSSKGIKPTAQFQLDLIFPDTIGARDDLRHIPNDLARSSIFTARNKSAPRLTLMQERLFHYNEHITVVYTGIELRAEDDEIVWLQIIKYGQCVPLGEPYQFALKDLVLDVGWQKNGRNYDRARECISRLKANEILICNAKAYGTSGALSLIQNYVCVNDADGAPTRYRVWIDPNMIALFAGNTFTSHTWLTYRNLSPVSRRLADYIASHQYPFPLSIERFRKMCGSNDRTSRSWRQTVRVACKEIVASGISAVCWLQGDQIVIERSRVRDG